MAAILRDLLKSSNEIIVCPGVFDGISAHVALQAGATCLYMTGAGTAASMLGEPDLAIATLTDFVQNGSMIVRVAKDVPVICGSHPPPGVERLMIDADTGFGGPINAARTVQRYEQAGIAALHIEDQISPKRCGHLLGKTVTSREEYASRISAACAAKSKLPSAPLIIARTDAIQPLSIDEALARMKQAHTLGAEIAFVEGILNESDAKKVVQTLHPMPCLLNLATNGNTPNWTVKQAAEMGFRVVIFPCAGMVPVVHALRASYAEIMEKGTDVEACRGMGPRGFFEVVGLKDAMDIDAKAGGVAYRGV